MMHWIPAFVDEAEKKLNLFFLFFIFYFLFFIFLVNCSPSRNRNMKPSIEKVDRS